MACTVLYLHDIPVDSISVKLFDGPELVATVAMTAVEDGDRACLWSGTLESEPESSVLEWEAYENGAICWQDDSGSVQILLTAPADGTLSDSFLSSNIPRLNTANTFTKSQTVTVDNANIVATFQSSYSTKYAVIDVKAGDGDNVRVAGIRLFDTSTGAGNRHWEVRKGDGNEFSVWYFDAAGSASRPLFISAGSPTNAFVINADGNTGLGTAAITERLTVNGNVSATRLLAAAGSLTVPSMSFSADDNTGFSNPYSNDTMVILAGGTQVGYINNSTLNFAPSSGGTNGAFLANVTNGGFGLRIFSSATGGADYRIGVTANAWAIGGERFVITPSTASSDSVFTIYNGKIGLGQGNTTPQATIHGTGSTILGTATSAVSDGNLGNGQVNVWLDESGGKLKFKIKTSTGTVKTATVSFDV